MCNKCDLKKQIASEFLLELSSEKRLISSCFDFDKMCTASATPGPEFQRNCCHQQNENVINLSTHKMPISFT